MATCDYCRSSRIVCLYLKFFWSLCALRTLDFKPPATQSEHLYRDLHGQAINGIPESSHCICHSSVQSWNGGEEHCNVPTGDAGSKVLNPERSSFDCWADADLQPVNDKLWPFKLQTYSHFAPTKLNTAYRFIFGEVIYSMQLVPQVFFTLPRGTLHYQPPQFQEDPTRSKRKNNSGLLHTTSSLLQPLRKMLQRTRLIIMKRLPSAIESNHRLSQPPLKKCARDRT